MKIAIGSDHAGFEQKEHLLAKLKNDGHDVVDVGTYTPESCDYPDAARDVARKVASGEVELGIVCCGSGIGVSIAANKVRGIRAAVVHDETTARLARTHNDANVLCLAGRPLDVPLTDRMVDAWLSATFAAGRHQRRIDKITRIEDEECSGR